MANTYDLTQLDANSFEHMVNFLALKVLGKGVAGFAQGADGGRDGLLIGEAAYPSDSERWSGTWYIQSKFHKPHLSHDPQKWLINEVKKELELFKESESRVVPEIWILATNIEPSGVARTGAFDKISGMVVDALGESIKFDIWGGRKVLDFLALDPDAASHYGHFLTPGNVLTAMYHQIGDSSAQVRPIINHLILDQFNDQVYTKLEQAGSSSVRPKIHELFVDLPACSYDHEEDFPIMETLVATSANVHRPTVWNAFGDGWRDWAKYPRRARIIVLKGGPGQGKSTAGQFYAQIQRASLLLEPDGPVVLPSVAETARELVAVATELNFIPTTARIPVSIELKDFATWHGTRTDNESKGIVSYLCEKIALKIDQKVEGGTLKRAFSSRSWFVNFDGLDEVPNDVKDEVAEEITRFTNVILPELDADVFVLCTTRPQGYSGQFENLNAVTLDLSALPPEVAMKCAAGVITFGRSAPEGEASLKVLSDAMNSDQVRELMTTPLQSHIMAVVVRDGGRPPEKRWELFDNFYQVMKKRESLKNFPDVRISKLLRENSILLKAIHARLGVSLHASAEVSKGAETTLARDQFCVLARQTTEKYVEVDVDALVEALMEATIERLVFVNTPESSSTVRFDIRQLQEFFAGEFIYSNVDPVQLRSRLEVIGGDAHWREVMHFAVSALIVTMRPTELAIALEVICNLDDSDDSHAMRIFKRRMGVGALLALRLLNEGVLEQDRSIRVKFKDAITPLYAMLETQVTARICAITHNHTVVWLLNCMVDALFEYSEPEQVGAAVVLCRRLPDSHSRLAEVRAKIFNSSPEYISAIYESFSKDHHALYSSPKPIGTNLWFWEDSLKLLLSPDISTAIKFELVARMIRFSGMSRSILECLSLSESHKLLLWMLVEPREEDKYPKKSSRINDVGIAEYMYTWKTKTLPPELSVDLTGFQSDSPVLRMIGHTIRFAQFQDLSDLCAALNAMVSYKIEESLLPRHLQVLLPVNFDTACLDIQLKFFQSITQFELAQLLDENYSGNYELPLTYHLEEFGAIDTANKLNAVAEVHPLFALAVWMEGFEFIEGAGGVVMKECEDRMLSLIAAEPSNMHFLFAGWGALFEKYPSQEKAFRQLFLKGATDGRATLQRQITSTFALDLPTEIDFLPLIVQVLYEHKRQPSRHVSKDGENLSRAAIIKGYGLDDQILKNIFEDESVKVVNRAAALCCYLCQVNAPNNHVRLSFFDNGLDSWVLKFAEENLPLWYPEAIAKTIRYLGLDDKSVMDFTGKILYAYRENYSSRQALQPLLAAWRERSNAPVSNKGVLDQWLGSM